MVQSNPPFGKKSSLTMVGADGREVREDGKPSIASPTRARSLVSSASW